MLILRPSIKGLKKKLKEERERIKALSEKINKDSAEFQKFKGEVENVINAIGVLEEKVVKMRNLYESLKKIDYMQMHSTVLESLEKNIFSSKFFDSIWKIKSDLHILQEKHAEDIKTALSNCGWY